MTKHEYPEGTIATVTLNVDLIARREYSRGDVGYEARFMDAEGDTSYVSFLPLDTVTNIVEPAPPIKEYKPGDVIDFDGPELAAGSIIADGERAYLRRSDKWHATSEVIAPRTWDELHRLYDEGECTYVGKI